MRTTMHLHVPVIHPTHTQDVLRGVWRLADPKITIASLVPFAAGVALAFEQRGAADWTLVIAAYLTIFFIEVGKNAVNDIYDFRSGADGGVREDERSPFSGGKRTILDSLLTENDLAVIGAVAFTLAALVGTEVARRASPALFVLGAAAALISVLYVMPPVKLSYRGLGELAVFAVYGPGIFLGAMLLLHATITVEAIVASVAFGVLIALVLLVNEIPDERADRAAGKNTLVVRLGREQIEQWLPFFFSLAVAIPTIAAAYGFVPFRMTVFFAAVPTAVYACWAVSRDRTKPPVFAQIATLATYAVTGVAFVLVIAASPR